MQLLKEESLQEVVKVKTIGSTTIFVGKILIAGYGMFLNSWQLASLRSGSAARLAEAPAKRVSSRQ